MLGLAQNIKSSLADYSAPFPIFYFEPFSEGAYAHLLANLPGGGYSPLDHAEAIVDGTSTRGFLRLDQSASGYWRVLSDELLSAELEAVFREAVGFEGPVRPVARLFRDVAGYRISPHPDSPKKACTVQFYLPSDDQQIALGTSFYRREADGHFTEVLKLPFLPNTGYCFKVTENSWHGVDVTIRKPRDSLILTYYKAG